VRSRAARATPTVRMLVPSAAGGLRLVGAIEAMPPDRSGPPDSSLSVALAIDAVEVASPAVRRHMLQAGFSRTAIDSESKRHRRLVQKLRAGTELNRQEEHFIAGALAIMSVLHLTTTRRAGGLGRTAARDFERAASDIMERAVPLPGLHAPVRQVAEWMVQGAAPDDARADASEAQRGEGHLAAADARARPGTGGMAGVGGPRALPVLRCSRQPTGAVGLPSGDPDDVAARSTSPQPDRPCHLGVPEAPRIPVASSRAPPSPLSQPAPCRLTRGKSRMRPRMFGRRCGAVRGAARRAVPCATPQAPSSAASEGRSGATGLDVPHAPAVQGESTLGAVAAI